MTEEEILVLHDTLYEYLNALHEADASFMFRVRRNDNKGKKGGESDDEGRLTKGYWFNGNDKYLETSFWDYKDNKHQTPIIRLVYYFELKRWACELVARDDKFPDRKPYFKKMADALGGFIEDKNPDILRKFLLDSEDFLTPLHNFIKLDKLRIDAYLRNNPASKTVDFITPADFEKDKKKINKYKISSKREGLVKEHIRLLNNHNKHLPFALSRIQIEKFQGIENVAINNIPTDTQWIFLTGENGFGKTSLLRAIGLGLVGDEYADEKHLTDTTLYVNGYNWNNPFMYEVKEQELATNNFQVVTYGVSRFRFQDDMDKNNKKTLSLFSDEGQLINIERVLIDAEQVREREVKKGIQPTTFDRIKAIFLKIIPKLADMQVVYLENEPITRRYQVRYTEQDEQNRHYKEVKLNDLAAGYRSILTMIGDMIVRLSNNQSDGYEDLKGIALIDEIDAHLHPKYQYELPKLLSEVFPNIQFIVSTHSPIPLLGLPKLVKSVVLTVDRNKEEGITIDRKDDDFDIYRLNPNAILTSPIFGFQELYPPDTTAKEILPVENFSEVERVNDIKKRMKALREQGLIQ